MLMMCELCGAESDLYNGYALADVFGERPYDGGDCWPFCGKCLKKIADTIDAAKSSKIETTESEARNMRGDQT